ncbi:hypothetical protein BU17DRAFT_67291 [Hysterangium stoloniferum]|nr:hypothetical protein BU17DRAFT_67291 [Hysterangium stoloniferum]
MSARNGTARVHTTASAQVHGAGADVHYVDMDSNLQPTKDCFDMIVVRIHGAWTGGVHVCMRAWCGCGACAGHGRSAWACRMDVLVNDYDRAFNKVLLLVDLARIELPLMSKISIQILDAFSRACGALWGLKVPSIWDTGEEWLSVLEPEKMETTKSNAKMDKNKEWEAELERQGAEKIDLLTIPPPPPAEPQPSLSSFSATVPLCFVPPPRNGTFC